MSDEGDADEDISGSSTPDSSSTYEYSHEPYETFQNKVLSLAYSLGDFEDVTLQRHRGGSYNRVVIARVTKDGEAVRGIFRIPRFFGMVPEGEENEREVEPNQVDGEVQDQAAVLHLLAVRKILAPRLLAFNASTANPLGNPYMFQQCSSGIPLNTVYGDMQLSEKLSIVDGFVRFLLSLEHIKFPHAGTVGAIKNVDTSVACNSFWRPDEARLQVEVQKTVAGADDTLMESLPDLLARKLKDWYEKQLPRGESSPVTLMWRRLIEIFKEMQAMEFFKFQNKSCVSVRESILFR
jgi:hypothetical protein